MNDLLYKKLTAIGNALMDEFNLPKEYVGEMRPDKHGWSDHSPLIRDGAIVLPVKREDGGIGRIFVVPEGDELSLGKTSRYVLTPIMLDYGGSQVSHGDYESLKDAISKILLKIKSEQSS